MLTADVTSFTQSSFDLDTGTLTILVSCVVELHSDQNTYNITFIVVSKNLFRSTREKNQGFYLRHTEFVEHTTIDTLIVLLFTKYRFSVREDISSQL